MAQFHPADGTTLTNPKTGAQQAAFINEIKDHLLSQGAGASRPVNLAAGGLWAKDIGGGAFEIYLYDGTSDHLVPHHGQNPTASLYATYGGTANAITLTTGLSLSALTEGQEFRFVPTANNTAASTAAIDGLTAIDIVTANGSATPADYLIAGHACIGSIDANGDLRVRWAVPYTGSNANGKFTKWDYGRMECTYEGAISKAAYTYVHAMPATFAAEPLVWGNSAVINPDGDSADGRNGVILIPSEGVSGSGGVTTSQWDFLVKQTQDAAAGAVSAASIAFCRLFAIGNWY